jgi:hypothetical protein
MTPEEIAKLPRLEKKAWIFHEANREVWVLVCEYAQRARKRRFKKFAIDMVWNVIRWERQLDVGPEHEFKLPNNHRASYSRWYNEMIGEEFFTTRRLRSLGGGKYDEFGREVDDGSDDDKRKRREEGDQEAPE